MTWKLLFALEIGMLEDGIRGRMHLLVKDDTNCLLTFQGEERSSKKLLRYF